MRERDSKKTLMQRIGGWLDKKNSQISHKKNTGILERTAWVNTYMVAPGKPAWTPRNYQSLAQEGYTKNVIVYQSINKIAQALSSVPVAIRHLQSRQMIEHHPLLQLLKIPNPSQSQKTFLEALASHQLIAGNAYILKIGPEDRPPLELHLLRPDRVQVIAGEGGIPQAYQHTIGNNKRLYAVHRLTGASSILHMKSFHPVNDWYGMSPIEAAAYSIDQHNQAGQWNQALLQNGARPSGALVVKETDGMPGGRLSEDQFTRLKHQIDEQFSGPDNAGRPFLLEGGLEWKEMSISPKEMDFLEAKHSIARDIALAFGVPPQLLGIPGDNTYSNLAEARMAFWEQTIIPRLDHTIRALNNWLTPHYGNDIELIYNLDQVTALAPRREKIWERLEKCNFLSTNEKRQMVGFPPVQGGDLV